MVRYLDFFSSLIINIAIILLGHLTLHMNPKCLKGKENIPAPMNSDSLSQSAHSILFYFSAIDLEMVM